MESVGLLHVLCRKGGGGREEGGRVKGEAWWEMGATPWGLCLGHAGDFDYRLKARQAGQGRVATLPQGRGHIPGRSPPPGGPPARVQVPILAPFPPGGGAKETLARSLARSLALGLRKGGDGERPNQGTPPPFLHQLRPQLSGLGALSLSRRGVPITECFPSKRPPRHLLLYIRPRRKGMVPERWERQTKDRHLSCSKKSPRGDHLIRSLEGGGAASIILLQYDRKRPVNSIHGSGGWERWGETLGESQHSLLPVPTGSVPAAFGWRSERSPSAFSPLLQGGRPGRSRMRTQGAKMSFCDAEGRRIARRVLSTRVGVGLRIRTWFWLCFGSERSEVLGVPVKPPSD